MRRGRTLLLVTALAASAACGPGQVDHPASGPAPEGSRLPRLTADSAGRPVLSWVESRGDGHALVYAVLDASGWQAPVTVAEGTGWMVNWADVPSVVPIDGKLWAAHWLVEQPGGMYAYDIALALSHDGGRTWDPPLTPHRDGTPTEHGFVSLWPAPGRPAPGSDGGSGVGALWLDGRQQLIDPSAARSAAPRTIVRSARFDRDGRRLSAVTVDDRVCDCCQTDVAVTDAGAVAVYRDRTGDEIRDVRAVLAGRSGWQALGTVARDGWKVDGCPVNGPAIAADGASLAVGWYTEARGSPRVLLARGRTPAADWSAPVLVDGDRPMGRVDVALLRNGDAAVVWLAAADEGAAQLRLARVSRDGSVGTPERIAAVPMGRNSGFPHLVSLGDDVLVAWTRWDDGVSRVVVRRLTPKW